MKRVGQAPQVRIADGTFASPGPSRSRPSALSSTNLLLRSGKVTRCSTNRPIAFCYAMANSLQCVIKGENVMKPNRRYVFTAAPVCAAAGLLLTLWFRFAPAQVPSAGGPGPGATQVRGVGRFTADPRAQLLTKLEWREHRRSVLPVRVNESFREGAGAA